MWLSLTLLASPEMGQAASVPLTERCNADTQGSVTIRVTDPTFLARILGSVVRPSPEQELFERLWQPIYASGMILPGSLWAFLRYEESQDLREIVLKLASDSQLTPFINLAYVVSGPICPPVWPPPPPVVRNLTEYFDLSRGHYRISASPEEDAAIDYGREAGSWVRTGEVLPTIVSMCSPPHQVYRFFAPSSRSYFFTASPDECGVLRKPNTGWHYQGVAFLGVGTHEGQCPDFAPRPIYRLYNNRWMFGIRTIVTRSARKSTARCRPPDGKAKGP